MEAAAGTYVPVPCCLLLVAAAGISLYCHWQIARSRMASTVTSAGPARGARGPRTQRHRAHLGPGLPRRAAAGRVGTGLTDGRPTERPAGPARPREPRRPRPCHSPGTADVGVCVCPSLPMWFSKLSACGCSLPCRHVCRVEGGRPEGGGQLGRPARPQTVKRGLLVNGPGPGRGRSSPRASPGPRLAWQSAHVARHAPRRLRVSFARTAGLARRACGGLGRPCLVVNWLREGKKLIS